MENLCLLSIEDSIKSRYSVRNYDKNKIISKEILDNIEEYVEALENPFGVRVRVRLVKKEKYDGVVKLGTYGVISGAKYYLVAACEKKDFAYEALGYTFEKAILYCTSLGLNSIWLGLTFNKSAFEKTINLKENEILPIVAPIGYEGGEKTFIASFFKSHRNNRIEFNKLFFDKDFNNKLIKNNDIYSKALEMVRYAPSSVNSQPWRIVKNKENFHIYATNKSKMNRIDIGIALCHLDLYLQENGIDGRFDFDNPSLNTKYNYIITWKRR